MDEKFVQLEYGDLCILFLVCGDQEISKYTFSLFNDFSSLFFLETGGQMFVDKFFNINLEEIAIIEGTHNLVDFILNDISFLVGKDKYSLVLMIDIALDLILWLNH